MLELPGQIDTKLNQYSHLPDLTDSSSYIAILRHAVSKTMSEYPIFVGKQRKNKSEISLTELLDPNGCFLFWTVSTLQIMRPFLLKNMPNIKGYTVYIESSNEAALDYKVQAIGCDQSIDLINPMVESLIGCFDDESESLFIDNMVRQTYLWFRNHKYPIDPEGGLEAFYKMTLPEND